MARRRFETWIGAMAAAVGLIAAGPARAEEPRKSAPSVTIEEALEAKRLNAEVARLHGQGKLEAAIPLAQRSLAIHEKALGPDHPKVAVLLNNLAELYSASGDLARAEPLLQRSLATREKALGPDHSDVAISLNSLAALHKDKGDLGRAEPLFQRSLAIHEKALGPDHPNVAASLNNLAELYRAKGDYARAESLYLRALTIKEKALGPDHPAVAASLNNMAWLCDTTGDLARAEPLYLRALAIWEKALGPDHSHVGSALNNLAVLYWKKGDLARAEPLYLRALAIREKALGPDHPHVATSLCNLAGLYDTKRDFERAEPLYQRALTIQEKTLGPDHPDIGSSLSNLAVLYWKKGDWARAEPLFERALRIQEKALGQSHPDVAQSLNNLAVLHQTKGDWARAEPLFERALRIQEKRLGQDHPDIAVSLGNLALMYIARGRSAEALIAARRAADIQDRNAIAVLAMGSEEQKRLYAKTLIGAGPLSLHIQHAPASPDAARLALTILLRRKGRVLDAMADSLTALRRSLDPGDRERLDKLAAVYSELASRASRGPGRASPTEYRKDLAALEQTRQTLEAEIAQRSAAFRAEQRPITLSDVQAKIPEGAALVEIARYRPFNPGAGGDQPNRWGAPRYAAYVLRRSGDPTFTDLGEVAAMDGSIDALRSALGDHDKSHDPKPAARALDRLLMQPIRRLLGHTRWVFLSPDGPLHLIPFGALVDEEGHYLIERYLFSYLTSGRDLIRFGDNPSVPREAPLILANPAFHDNSAPKTPEGTRRGLRSIDMVTQALPPLESTIEEANSIARLFPGSRVRLGAEATEEAVKAARAPLLLHLATHGFFLPEQPVPEELLRDPGTEPTPEERAALLQRENPLLRSGIALAGFNRRRSGNGNDDGVLTALEAAGLDLSGTRLVVLSTCESGMGEATSGEGVYGLRRALTMAGSETQVMSLWQVDTGRTRELMQAYYQRLKDGSGRSEAMRDVQLAMLSNSKTAHPNLWASFIVSGEWRTLEGQARPPAIGKVSPSARGCACEQAGGDPQGAVALLALALGLSAAAWRRRRPA